MGHDDDADGRRRGSAAAGEPGSSAPSTRRARSRGGSVVGRRRTTRRGRGPSRTARAGAARRRSTPGGRGSARRARASIGRSTTSWSKYSRAIARAARAVALVVAVDLGRRRRRPRRSSRTRTSPSPVGRTLPKPVSWVIDRPPGREVGGAAIAEPAGAQPDVLVLGDRELAARAADVGAVGVQVDGEVEGVGRSASRGLQQRSVLVAVAAQRQLEALPVARRAGRGTSGTRGACSSGRSRP